MREQSVEYNYIVIFVGCKHVQKTWETMLFLVCFCQKKTIVTGFLKVPTMHGDAQVLTYVKALCKL